MKRIIWALVVCVSIGLTLALAQNTEPKGVLGGVVGGVPGGVLTVGPTEFLLTGGPVVKGAPFSAEAVSESVQMLADGNRIAHSSSYKIFRDSEGRTRREMGPGWTATNSLVTTQFVGGQPVASLSPSGLADTLISDPVAGASYSLNEQTKTARKLPMPVDVTKALAAARAKAATSGSGTAQEGRVTVNVDESGHRIAFNVAPGPDMAAQGTLVKAPSDPNVVTESLGTQVIEGVEAQGSRSTRTIPAGGIGNDLPIVITIETWYSPKLRTTVLSKRHDPRTGDTTFQLTNLSQAEPAASLFEVPGDYTVVDTKVLVPLPATATTLAGNSIRAEGAGAGCGTTQRLRISQGVAEGLLVSKVEPVYPPLAQQARIQGQVILQAVIGCDGTVQSLRLVSGHPMLAPAAMDAVKQWRYKPYLLNGQPVEVETTVTITFGGIAPV